MIIQADNYIKQCDNNTLPSVGATLPLAGSALEYNYIWRYVAPSVDEILNDPKNADLKAQFDIYCGRKYFEELSDALNDPEFKAAYDAKSKEMEPIIFETIASSIYDIKDIKKRSPKTSVGGAPKRKPMPQKNGSPRHKPKAPSPVLK